MRLEFINRIKENEILGKNIFTSEGKILLKAGTKLSNSYLEKMKNLGVYYLYIIDERLEDISVEDEILTELKQHTMNSISTIIKSTFNYNKKQMSESLGTVETLIQYLISNGDINKSLYDIQTYSNSTYVHSLNVCIMSVFLGQSLGLREKNLTELGTAAILHDIGKKMVPINILNKITPLTQEEADELKRHTIYGEEILRKNVRISEPVIRAVLEHHERVDGNGYPHGLVDTQISRFAKIIAVSDVYDTISNTQTYKKNYTPQDAYELILAGSGILFDKLVVQKFRQTFAVYPLGCCVKLSNGVEGYIIMQNDNFPDRPIIRVLYDYLTKEPIPFYEIDLLKNLNLIIKEII